MINQAFLFFKRIFEGPLSISLFRILGYNKPYRAAIVRILPINNLETEITAEWLFQSKTVKDFTTTNS